MCAYFREKLSINYFWELKGSIVEALNNLKFQLQKGVIMVMRWSYEWVGDIVPLCFVNWMLD